MDILKFFTVRLCPWDMHLTGRRSLKKIDKKMLMMESRNEVVMGGQTDRLTDRNSKQIFEQRVLQNAPLFFKVAGYRKSSK